MNYYVNLILIKSYKLLIILIIVLFIRKPYIISYHYNEESGVLKLTEIILVGCGKEGSIHCKCHTKLRESNVKITAMVDSDPDRLKRPAVPSCHIEE